jgi:hypothetical protein
VIGAVTVEASSSSEAVGDLLFNDDAYVSLTT